MLYRDSKLGLSDPASSGLQYLKADGAAKWAAAVEGANYLDEKNLWSKPVLKPTSVSAATPAQLKDVAKDIAGGSSAYNSWVGQKTQAISFGSYGSSTFTLVGINHSDKCTINGSSSSPTPATWRMVFMADSILGTCAMSSASTLVGGWMGDENTALTYIMQLISSMDSAWSTVLATVGASIVGAYSQTLGMSPGTTSPQKLFIPSLYNLNRTSTGDTPSEGQPFSYFKSHTSNSELIRRSGSTARAYMTRSFDRYSGMSPNFCNEVIQITTTGSYSTVAVNTSLGVVPCFVINE